jgi:hypothetical protein
MKSCVRKPYGKIECRIELGGVQFGLDSEWALVVGVYSCAVVREDLLHADIRVVNGILTHRR